MSDSKRLMIHTTAIGVKPYSMNTNIDVGSLEISRATRDKFNVPSSIKTYSDSVRANISYVACYDLNVVKNKWSDIGYGIIIEKNGTMYVTGREINKTNYAAAGFNDVLLGQMNNRAICRHIAISGANDVEWPTPEQMDAIRQIIKKWNITEIVYHRDFTKDAKSCPGELSIKTFESDKYADMRSLVKRYNKKK